MPGRSDRARAITERYLAPVRGGPANEVESRVRDLWWPELIGRFDAGPHAISATLDELDVCMDVTRTRLAELASDYAISKGFSPGSAGHVQRVSQFLKSNTGKMFERFIGYSIAEALERNGSRFAIYGFNATGKALIPGYASADFDVQVVQGARSFPTPIDSDLIAFDPTGEDERLFMISVKSTLKDRFHNVPFWNLLRRAALDEGFPTITASNPSVLNRVVYVAACTDLATEQPDFSSDLGPRNLLQIDAALLDGAFVTGSRTRGLVQASGAVAIGPNRAAPFMMLSSLMPILH
jgi:hypothetical protein